MPVRAEDTADLPARVSAFEQVGPAELGAGVIPQGCGRLTVQDPAAPGRYVH